MRPDRRNVARMGWKQLSVGVELPFDAAITIPAMHEVELSVPTADPLADVERAARDAVVACFAGEVKSGMTVAVAVAVGAGSRGLTARVELLRGTIAGLRQLGADPFVVPAMGSHGGAHADGQRTMLAHLGMTEESLGAEIRATMETAVVATTPDGMTLHLDLHSAGADRILPVNRIKPHTCFKGPIESGCTKMAVVGFGKQPGRHRSTRAVRCRCATACWRASRRCARPGACVGSIESPDGDVVRVEALSADDVGGSGEIELTEYARTFVPALPFGDIDVLIVEQGGKDISGTTMDPNVTGRFWVKGLADFAEPSVSTIVLLSITDVSEGNVLGVGFADFVPAALADQIDWQKTYVDCFTAGPSGLRRARLPMVLPDEESCIKAALQMCGTGFDQPKRVVRIRSTLHLTRCWVSDAVAADLPSSAQLVRGQEPPGRRASARTIARG